MLVDVVMPKMGESIQEGKILRWMKKPGDKVELDETILEISTDKVDSEIPSPAAGFLSKIVVPEGETVEVGTVIAAIETSAGSLTVGESSGGKSVAAEAVHDESSAQGASSKPVEVLPERPARRGGNRFYSPLVRSIAEKEGIAPTELDGLQGTGLGGRVTKKDLEHFLKTRWSEQHGDRSVVHPADLGSIQKKYPPPAYEVIQMDNLQQKMAEHMVRSVRTSPHVEAISECDFTKVADFRA